jgi:hypothetical protein
VSALGQSSSSVQIAWLPGGQVASQVVSSPPPAPPPPPAQQRSPEGQLDAPLHVSPCPPPSLQAPTAVHDRVTPPAVNCRQQTCVAGSQDEVPHAMLLDPSPPESVTPELDPSLPESVPPELDPSLPESVTPELEPPLLPELPPESLPESPPELPELELLLPELPPSDAASPASAVDGLSSAASPSLPSPPLLEEEESLASSVALPSSERVASADPSSPPLDEPEDEAPEELEPLAPDDAPPAPSTLPSGRPEPVTLVEPPQPRTTAHETTRKLR